MVTKGAVVDQVDLQILHDIIAKFVVVKDGQNRQPDAIPQLGDPFLLLPGCGFSGGSWSIYLLWVFFRGDELLFGESFEIGEIQLIRISREFYATDVHQHHLVVDDLNNLPVIIGMFDDHLVADFKLHIGCEVTILSCGGNEMICGKLEFAKCEFE